MQMQASQCPAGPGSHLDLVPLGSADEMKRLQRTQGLHHVGLPVLRL